MNIAIERAAASHADLAPAKDIELSQRPPES
jgi:hypothetical protein